MEVGVAQFEKVFVHLVERSQADEGAAQIDNDFLANEFFQHVTDLRLARWVPVLQSNRYFRERRGHSRRIPRVAVIGSRTTVMIEQLVTRPEELAPCCDYLASCGRFG